MFKKKLPIKITSCNNMDGHTDLYALTEEGDIYVMIDSSRSDVEKRWEKLPGINPNL